MALLERLSSLGHGHRQDTSSPPAHSLAPCSPQSDDAAAFNRKQYISPWDQTVTGPAYDSGAYNIAGITQGNGGECLSEVGLAASMASPSPQLRRPRADSGLPAASDDDCAHDYDIASDRTYDDGAMTDDSAIEDMHTPLERDRDSGLYDDDHDHDYDPATCRTYDRANADESEGGGEAVENNGSAQPHLPPQPIPRSRTSFDEHDYDLGSSKTYAEDEADGEVGVQDAAETAVADEDIVAQLPGLPAPLPQPRTSFDEHDYDLGSSKTYAEDEADGEAIKDGGDAIGDDGDQQAELPGPAQPGTVRRRITVWFDEHDYDIASTKTYADDGQDGAAADVANASGVLAAVAAVSAAMQQAERGAISPSAGQGQHDASPVVLRRHSDDALKATGAKFPNGRKLAASRRRSKQLRRRESAPAGMRGFPKAAETTKTLTQSRPYTVHEACGGMFDTPVGGAEGDAVDSATMTSTGSNVTLTRTDSTTTITPTLRSQSELVPEPPSFPDHLWPCTAMLLAQDAESGAADPELPSTSGPESAPFIPPTRRNSVCSITSTRLPTPPPLPSMSAPVIPPTRRNSMCSIASTRLPIPPPPPSMSAPVIPPTRRNSMCSIASTRVPIPPPPPSMSAPVIPPTRRNSLCSIASMRLPIGSPTPGAAGVYSTIGRSKSLSPGSMSTASRGLSDDGERRIGIQVWQPKMGPPPPPPSGPAPPPPAADEGPIPIRPWQSPKTAHQTHFSATAPSPKRAPPPMRQAAVPPPLAPTIQPAVITVSAAAAAATAAVWTPTATGAQLRSGSCPATTAAGLEQFAFVRRRGLRRMQGRSQPCNGVLERSASMSDGMFSVGAAAGPPPPTGKDRPRSASVPSLGETLTAWMGQRPTPPTPPTRPSLEDSVALPDGWGTAKTPKGKTYYVHHLTQIISWVHPTKQSAALLSAGTDL